ncbi:MAG: tryptophan synthase subunit alpha [Chitinispirillaceae bacterium]|nr:tryptophan synthase subunit alpha [Chitinispirillaceae bacterium]
MNRYANVFNALKRKGEIAFIPFAVAGDPDLATSEKIFNAYIEAGADILEIGYPFSDPIADGPVNQRAALRAMNAGLNHANFFALMRRLRSATGIPFGLLCYANTILHRGVDRFCEEAAAAGIDSILVADLPPEESGDLRTSMHRCGLGQVFIASELTPPDRLRFICSQVDSFVYVVSRLGTTGIDTSLSVSVRPTIRRLKKTTRKPLAVGFGISTPDHVAAVKKAGADAAIVGSALVSLIEKHEGTAPALLALLKKKVTAYKAATRN